MEYKVWVIADSSGKWCTNAMEYKTYDIAMDAARDLQSRWMLVTDFCVKPVGTNPNEELKEQA